jgi:hypothetical protein
MAKSQWIMKTPNTTFSGCRFAAPLVFSLDDAIGEGPDDDSP